MPSKPRSANSLRPIVDELLAALRAGHPRRPRPALRPLPERRPEGRPSRQASAGRRRPTAPCVVRGSACFRRAAPRPASGRRSPSRPARAQMTRARGVDLAAQHAVARAGRVGVVQVVPRLAHGRAWPATRRWRTCRATDERPLAERVADRVDRPGHVVQQGDAHQRAPEERGHRALPRPRDQAAERRPAQQRDRDPHRELASRSGRCRGPSAGRGVLRCGWSARRRTATPCGRRAGPSAAPARCRRTATASAGRRRGRRTCGAGGGRPPSA